MSHVARAGPSSRLLSATAVMAAGTVVSRASGFVRSALLVAAVGLTGAHADAFNVANTIPNTLYILLAGGVFNAVLVPQLVRAMARDPDGGEAYTNRIITASGLFLAVVTVLLTLAAPLLMDLYLSSDWDSTRLAEARESAVDFARWCLPQVFFYGMFVLVGQVLNSRERFAPMMWAPIANNVISIGVLAAYLSDHGAATSADRKAGFGAHAEALLGFGSTAGIVVQLLILLPYLQAAGFTYRPRFDFRDTGLGHTLRLGTWTVLFVVVNQVAFAVVVRLASGGGAAGGAGFSVYTQAFLVVMVPHSVITVSLATALLPRLSAQAADGDLRALSRSLIATLRSALGLLLPLCALLPVLAGEIAAVMLALAGGRGADVYTQALALFAPGVVLTSVHYLLLRGLYALEQNRTAFVNQAWVAVANVVGALVAVHVVSPRHIALGLIVAYDVSYLIGAVLSVFTLRRLLGGIDGARTVRFCVRLALATAIAAGVGWTVELGLARLVDADRWPAAIGIAVVVTAVTGGLFWAAARAMHLREVTSVVRTLTGPKSSTRSGG